MSRPRMAHLLALIAGLGLSAAQAAPTISITHTPEPFVAGTPYSVTWTTTGAKKASFVCTASGTGYKGSGNAALNGSKSGTASASWIGYPSSCTWTLTAPDNSVVTHQEAPRTTVLAPDATISVQRAPSPLVVGQGFTLSWSTTNAKKLTYGCTASGTGYKITTATVALSGSSSDTALAAWVGKPSTCTWKATGINNKVITYTETMTTVAAPSSPAPTLNVSRTPNPLVAGQSYTTSWSSTNASQVSYNCTATGSGYNATSGTLAPSGSQSGTAQSGWVPNPSTCTWTATGAGGSKNVIETVTTVAAPQSGPANYNLGLSYVPAGQGGAGLVQTVTYPSGKQLTHQYDATGQLTGLLWNNQPLLTNLTWTPLGMPKSWRWPFVTGASDAQGPGLTLTREYNTAGQLTDSGIATYTWDAAGRVSNITQQLFGPASSAGGPASAFTVASAIGYDAAGRLTSYTQTPGTGLPTGIRAQDLIGPLSASYTFDANGNRQSASYQQFGGSGNTESYSRTFTLDASHNKVLAVQDSFQMSSGSTPTETRNLQWDASGRLTNDGKFSFEYDPQGRVNKITGELQTTRYRTNALNQRVRKTNGAGQATDTVYGEEEMAPGLSSYPIGHYQPGTTLSTQSTEYLYLPTAMGPMPIAVQIADKLYAIHSDHLNTPRRLTDTQGNPVWQWVISSFGELEPADASTGFIRERLNTPAPIAGATPIEFNLRYPGQQHDKETGLYYNHHRYYDPYLTVGYTQADPIGLAGGWNRFTYASGNPFLYIDPEGLAGHHYVPRAVWGKEDLLPETRRVFERATTGPIPGGHNYGDGHAAYNRAVQEMWDQYKKGINCEKMTPEQAQRFVDMVRQSTDPRIRSFLLRIYQRIVNGALRRGLGGRSEE